jgi:hypothetical protein
MILFAINIYKYCEFIRIKTRLSMNEGNKMKISIRNVLASEIGDHIIGMKGALHVNASTTGKARGWEIHTSPGQTISDTYATQFWQETEKRGLIHRFCSSVPDLIILIFFCETLNDISHLINNKFFNFRFILKLC